MPVIPEIAGNLKIGDHGPGQGKNGDPIPKISRAKLKR
jgi:hypothetical protein